MKTKETDRIKVQFEAKNVYVDAYDLLSGSPESAIEQIQDIIENAKRQYPESIRFWFYDDSWGEGFYPKLWGERYENDAEYAKRMEQSVKDKAEKKEKARLKLEAEQKEYERLKAKFEKK